MGGRDFEPSGSCMKPLVIDLFCGRFGWSKGFLSEGYRAVGFDLEQNGPIPEGAELVRQHVLTLHGSQFRHAAAIVASPPCQRYSYMAMPWDRAKREIRWQEWERDSPFGNFTLNDLFNACFRIQREASEAAGRHIPMVVENVVGAQRWIGSAAWHFGSYYLWGDVPALMPRPDGAKGATGSWCFSAETRGDPREASRYSLRSTAIKMNGTGAAWFDAGFTKFPSRSERRKAASAAIAEIPFDLAQHIARVFKPSPTGENAPHPSIVQL
jgi:hypothetical protein